MARHDPLVAWLLCAAVGVVLLLTSVFIVLFFQPTSAGASAAFAVASSSSSSSGSASTTRLPVASRFVNVVCILALFLSLACLFLAPVDVFLLEHELPHAATALRVIYQVCFGCLAFYSFVGAPLVYNYARQTEIAHITMLFSAKQRLAVACKRTLCYLLGLTLLLSIAMVLLLCGKPTHAEIDWLKPLLHFSTDVAMLFRLVIGVLAVAGLYLWVSVCSRGLVSVPLVGLLMENHAVDEHQYTFEDLLRENAMERQATEQTKDTILRRYAVEQQMSTADQERLEQLKLREHLLTDRRAVLEANLQRFSLAGRWQCWRVPVGAVLLLLSLVILVSLLITSLDKMAHSSFGKGFLLNEPTFPNPIDGLLVLASSLFPLDYVLFGVLYLYLFVVSFVMLMRHGVRFLCFRLDRLQPRLTAASTMAIVTLVLINISVVGLFSVLTLAPQYATFGHQSFADEVSGVVRRCTLEESVHAAGRHCRMTQLARFYNSLAASFPLFGLAFLLGQFAFVFAFAPWLLHSYCMARPLPDPDPKRERLLDNY
ncbi:hypothetical protein PINS_up012637 [Pythium insidiosum]|nr:hypothetical protein PINS_up012637 [Pythium insidiosum]